MTENTVPSLSDVLAILNTAPGFYLVLLPDAPRFSIVAVTDDYLSATCAKRKEVIDRGLFEVISAKPESPDDADIIDLKVSLTQVLKEKVPNYAPGSWHPGIAKAGNNFNKVWKWFNKPVLNANGDVQYIIHSIEYVDGKTDHAGKLRDEHRLLQEAQAIGSFGNFEWNVGNEEVVWSDGMYRIAGIEPQGGDITIKRINNLVHPDDFAKVHQVTEASLITPGHYELTHRLLLDDGTVKWVIHRFESISDINGKVVRVHGTLQDVTKLKGAEHKLLQGKNAQAKGATDKYLALVNSIDQGFCTISVKYNEDGRPVDYQFIEVSPSFEQQTGIKDAAGKWMRDIAEDQDEFWFETYGRIAEERKSERFEYFSTPLNRWWSVYAFPIDEPELRRIGVLFNDITEQIKAKKRLEASEIDFRNVLLQSPNIFVILKGFPDMIITFANEPLYKSWGRTAEIIGKPLLEALPELKGQSFPTLLQGVFETGETYHQREEKAVLIKNGVPVDTYYEYVYQAIFDDRRKVTGVTIMATDITEQVLLRKKIETNEKELQNIFLNAPAAICILEGREHKYILANKAYEKLTNRKAEDLLGKNTSDVFPELIGTVTFEIFDTVFQTGESFVAPEYAAILDLNNEGVPREYYFHFSMVPLKNNSGEIYAVMAITYDITEQVVIRKKIEENEKHQSFLLKLSDALRPPDNPGNIGKAVTKIAMDFMDADRCHYSTIEEDSAIILSDSSRGDLPSIAGAYPTGSYTLFKARVDAGHPFIVEDVQTTNMIDEELKQLSIQLQVISFIDVPVNKNGKTVGLLSLVQSKPRKWTGSEVQLAAEIAERTWAAVERANVEEALRKSEEKYRTLFNSIDQGCYRCEVLFDENNNPGDILYLEENPAAIRMLGRSYIGKTLKQVNLDYEDYWFRIWGEVAVTGESKRMQQYSRTDKKWFEFQVSRLRDNESKEIVVVFQDITEIKQQQKKQAFLLRLSDTLRSLKDPGRIEGEACRLIGEELRADRAYYIELNMEEGYGVVFQDYSREDLPSIVGRHSISPYQWSLSIYCNNQPLIITDSRTSDLIPEQDRKAMEDLHLIAELSVPLIKDGVLVGALIIADALPREWNNFELELVYEVGERIWSSVEKAKAEERLRQSEEKYLNILEGKVRQRTDELKKNTDLLQTVFDASPNSLAVFEILSNDVGAIYDFKILSFNAFTIKTIGGKNFIGQKYSEAFPHVVDSGVLHELIKAADTGEQIEFEKWYLGEGMHNCFRFIANRTGNLLLVTTEDITARKVAEEKLRTNLTLLQQSEDLAKIGSWEYEIATGKSTWSDGMYELFGLPKGVNLRPEIYLDHVIKDDYPIAQRILKCFNEPQAFEETLKIKKGESVREIKIKASIVTDENGDFLKLVGVDLDITEAKQSENTLKEQAHFIRSTNKALPDILFVMNLVTKEFTYINHSFEERLGYSVERESSNSKNMFHLLYEEDVPAMLAHIEEMKAVEDSVIYEMEYRLKAADGSLRWYKDRNSVFRRSKSGAVIEKIGIAQDISKSKKAEQELRESNISLRYANENLEQFASVASHDLQEPLRKLKLFATTLQRYDKELPEEAKAVIQKISLTSGRMRQLVTEVLQYSKVAYGIKKFILTNLDHILHSVLGDLDLLLADSDATIKYNEPLPEIEAVPLQMNQLFYNLLTNAIKFCKDAETPVIHISHRIMASAEVETFSVLNNYNPHIEIQFSDNGIGFQQAYAQQIFQLFERLFSLDEYEGTGVGLALCKKITENHNGHIYAKSTDGEGATFYILLPISQKNMAEKYGNTIG